ncbi:MAG: DUF6680 family protein [Burkholderiaceae bacterium]
MLETLKFADLAIIFATFAGPIAAVWASEYRQSRRAEDERKERIFSTLWTTRSSNLDTNHVQALNHIDLAFPAAKYPAISEAWRLYQAQLKSDRGNTEDSIARWEEKSRTLREDLIFKMAADLHIKFPKSMVIQPSYRPIAHTTQQEMQHQINIALLRVLNGEHAIQVKPQSDYPLTQTNNPPPPSAPRAG